MQNKNNYFDILLFVAVVIIAAFGIVMIYSSSEIWAEFKFNDAFKFVKHQLLFYFTGIIGMIILSRIDYKIYLKKPNLIVFGCFILLVLVLIPAIGMARIVSYLNPWSDPLGSGFQIIQSLYAISPGGLFQK